MGSMQTRVGVSGPAPLTAQRQEFAKLVAKGVSNSEACRLVGVNRRTGTRWRYGRTVTFKSGAELQYPPMAITRTTCLSARFLSEDERVLIADRVRAGASLRAIGRELGVLPRRSAGRCAATVTTQDGTARSPLSGWPCSVWFVPRSAGWRAIRCCGTRSRGGWTSDGAPNRSLTRYGCSTRTRARGTWSTRASTRRSTQRTGPYDGTGTPVFGPDAAVAGHAGARRRDVRAP